MNNKYIKNVNIIADNSKSEIINCIKNAFDNVQFVHKFSHIEQIFQPGFTISEESLKFNINDGIKIKRTRNKFLLLCEKANLNNELIINIQNNYENIFDIYIETIDNIYECKKNNDIDSFAFKNAVYELFKPYMDIDYLIII